MPSAKSTAAITVTHKPTTSRLIAVRQTFYSREVGMATGISCLRLDWSPRRLPVPAAFTASNSENCV